MPDTVWKPAPPSDPELTKKLWDTVNSMKARGSENDVPPIVELETASVTESEATTQSEETEKIPGPRETGFWDAVLKPHHISIDLTINPSPGAFVYFGTEPNTNYSELEGLAHINIWLDTAQAKRARITAEYREMGRLKLCEAEFSTFARENLLKGPKRADLVNEDERFRTQRLISPSLLPDEFDHWKQPPCFEDVPVWSWDVRPDCSYWLSLRGFNEDYQTEIQGLTYVKENVACPYFTTEFKRDDDPAASISPAIHQVASTGCIALYNRFCLWRAALALNFKNWSPTPFHEIRHFGLTFAGGSFSVWVLKPVLSKSGEWAGCTMERLDGGILEDSTYDAGTLMQWINEFHRWGLTVHGPACKNEIKICLRGKGVRTSGFGLD
jgi:hypothetical protein